MKTLQIGMGWFPEEAGGLNRFYYDFCRNAPDLGIAIDGLLAGSNQAAQDSQGMVRAFSPRDAPLMQRWCSVRSAVNEAMSLNQYDLIGGHFALYTFPTLDLIARKPVVIHFQGPWSLEGEFEGGGFVSTKLKWIVEKLTYRRASRFIVLSDAFKQTLHCRYQVPLNKIDIVPPGVDINRFNLAVSSDTARKQLLWPEKRPIILSVRRLASRMGLENLIDAMVEVRKHRSDAILMIAGKGILGEMLRRKVESLGLSDNVRLLGFVSDSDLALAYRAANFSIVPTIALEGFGLILIESLANGTPVMGTPVDSIPEILGPFCQDLLFEGASSQHLANGMIEALEGRRTLPSSEACQQYVQRYYTWSVASQRVKAVYQRAIEEFSA